MTKSNRKTSPELEPYRSSMAGTMAMAPGYEFKFHKPTSNVGGVTITDLDSKKAYNTGYALHLKNGKCQLTINLDFNPFNIPDAHSLDFDYLDRDLTKLLEFVK